MGFCAFSLTNMKDAAVRRYTFRVLIAMIVYMAAIFGVSWIFSHRHPSNAAAWLLAALPSIPIISVLAIFGIYLTEVKDEFVRMLAVRSSLWATAITLGFASFWGFIETYTHPPLIPMYWLFVLWWIVFGFMQAILSWRYR